MIECKPSLAGLQATQCRDVDARSARNLLECEATLHAQVTQAPTHPQIDAVLSFCLHSKKAWHLGHGACKVVAWSLWPARWSGRS